MPVQAWRLRAWLCPGPETPQDPLPSVILDACPRRLSSTLVIEDLIGDPVSEGIQGLCPLPFLPSVIADPIWI